MAIFFQLMRAMKSYVNKPFMVLQQKFYIFHDMLQCLHNKNFKKLNDPFLWISLNCLKTESHYEETGFFWPLIHQEFLVLIWLASEGS